MADGTRVQERDISNISSTRRNPVLADILGRLGYMERQGSGFKKITEAYYAAHNYRAELEPKFYSDAVSFQVTLYNLNYNVSTEKVAIGEKNVAIAPDYIATNMYQVAETTLYIVTLATVSGVSPSTIYSMLDEKSKNPGIVSLKKICDGLDISIREFFDDDVFDGLEQEIE